MKQKGFTLVELLVTLSILAILTTMAAPTFSNIFLHAKQDSNRLKWSTFLNSARSNSIHMNVSITVCPAANNQCNRNNIGSWTSFIDENKNGNIDDDEVVLNVLSLNSTTTTKLNSSFKNRLIYRSTSAGEYSGPTASISVCPNGRVDEYAFHIRLNIMGRLAYEEKRNDDGIPMRKTSSGWKKISC